jgi:signal transduction histidine kinase
MIAGLLRNLSLQKKFILVTSVAVIAFMLIVGFLITRRESVLLYRDIEQQGRLLAETLAIPVMNDLLYERLGLVEEGGLIDNYVTETFKSEDIDLIYIVVLDEVGKVITHNDFNEYGKAYQDTVTLNALSSDTTIIQRFTVDDIGQEALDVATPLSIGKKRWGTLKFAISLERVDSQIRATIVSAIIVTVVLLAGAFGVIFLLSRRFIAPITELSRTMERAGGETLDVVADIRGSDEIAHLGHSFNRMIDRIREANAEITANHEQLVQFAKTIEKTGGDTLDVKVDIKGSDEIELVCESFNRMIDRIREANTELKRTNEKLLHSQKLASLGILTSGVAHEINNPLGGMFNCIRMLEQQGESEEFRRRYLDLMKNGLSRIENTVGKLLWMSRKEERQPGPVNVRELVEDVHAFLEYRIKNSEITYHANVSNGVSLFMDPHDFEQMMINLMVNAVQSMKHGGTLQVNAYGSDSEVVVEVCDTGDGMDQEDLHQIFDPFYTTKQPGEGTGLGLWLTYEIVHNYGGDISVQSRKGHGSTFTLRFNGA